nr:uncharacterized protein LOC129271837 [Lytechinus pictus]
MVAIAHIPASSPKEHTYIIYIYFFLFPFPPSPSFSPPFHIQSELREQDVSLARQLLVVYDYVEETKWFLENFEACDPRHSIAGPLTSTERRFSQNFQKRLSDFGLNLKGIPHNGFASPPSWTDLSGSKTTPKRHSRNISDGMISIEHLRRIYHENNNNAAAGMDKSESCEALPEGPLLDGSEGRSRSPRSMTRRSISSNFLEISFSSMTASKGDHGLHQGPLSPISDSGQAVTMDEDADGDDKEEEGEKRNVHLQSTPKPVVEMNSPDTFGNDAMAAEERTKESESVSFYIPRDEDEVSVDSHSTADHHRGSASSSSASSMMSLQSSLSSSSSSTDTHAKSNSSHQTCQNTTETMSALPPHSTTGSSTDTTADECSIFIADDSNDHIAEDNRTLITSFESHMNWLQEQDETLL